MARVQICEDADAAVSDIADGSTVMIGGFYVGRPTTLVAALARKGCRNLTVIANASGLLTPLAENHQITKFIGSSTGGSRLFEEQYLKGDIEVVLMPQGTLAECIRAGGGGIGAFYTPTGVGTVVERGKEKRTINGREYLLEYPLKADYALIRAWKADTLGNLAYRRAGRNFNPIMATAATVTVAEVDEVVNPKDLDPETIGTHRIYVHRIVRSKGES